MPGSGNASATWVARYALPSEGAEMLIAELDSLGTLGIEEREAQAGEPVFTDTDFTPPADDKTRIFSWSTLGGEGWWQSTRPFPMAALLAADLLQKGSVVTYKVYVKLPSEVDADTVLDTLRPHLTTYHLTGDTARKRAESLGRTIGPVWGNASLQRFGESMPYLSAAGLLLLTLLLSVNYQIEAQVGESDRLA